MIVPEKRQHAAMEYANLVKRNVMMIVTVLDIRNLTAATGDAILEKTRIIAAAIVLPKASLIL